VSTLGFVTFDDPDYVTANPHVLGGLTWQNVQWALTSTESANWFPLTWLSHMTDVAVFGVNSAAHHLVNAGLHLATTVLLFLLFVRMTQAIWRSAFVAFVFGFHPLHVESVAWVAERKDILSGLFCVLTLWGYAHYVAQPTRRRYVLMATVFALALTTKSMLVTLPLLLLCLDFWPLRRFSRAAILEKLPLLALSTAVSIVTFLSQRSAGAVLSLAESPLRDGLINAIVSYGVYMRQTIWPARLSAFYPWTTPDLATAALTGAFLVLTFVVALRLRSTRPYLLSGYLWFLICLLPVIGIVPFGLHAHADRYMYLPLIGLAMALAWSAGAWVEGRPGARSAVASIAVASCCVLAAVTWRQLGYWETTQRLFEHALDVTPGNPVAHEALGMIARQSGDLDGAIRHYQEAVRVWPRLGDAQSKLGEALIAKDQPAEAVPYLQRAIAAQPGSPDAYVYLGTALRRLNDTAQAEQAYRTALGIKPDDALAHLGLAECLADRQLPNEAGAEAWRALTLAANDPQLRRAAYRLLVRLGQGEAAAKAAPDLASTSGDAQTHLDQATAFVKAGRFEEAASEFRAALAIDPANAKAHANLGAALASLGRFDAAIDEFVSALKLNPGLPDVQRNLDLARELKRRR
jgi:tetratricopeptide (TPR) repeat protein